MREVHFTLPSDGVRRRGMLNPYTGIITYDRGRTVHEGKVTILEA